MLFQKPRAERPLRFPITRYKIDPPSRPTGDAAKVEPKPAAFVLANGALELLNDSGKALWSVEGAAAGRQFSAAHGIAVDVPRQRIYVAEAGRIPAIIALDFHGQKIWRVENLDVVPAVDPKTGNLWSSGGSLLNVGETIVLDADGNELATYPYRALDLAYDPHDDAVWVAGYQIVKLDRAGKVLFQQAAEGWCCSSVRVNPTDGSAWILEHGDPNGRRARTKDRSWLFNADGAVRQLGTRPRNSTAAWQSTLKPAMFGSALHRAFAMIGWMANSIRRYQSKR